MWCPHYDGTAPEAQQGFGGKNAVDVLANFDSTTDMPNAIPSSQSSRHGFRAFSLYSSICLIALFGMLSACNKKEEPPPQAQTTPTATPKPKGPADYLNLMSANPDSLPPEEAPIARALNETGKMLADVDAAAKPFETNVEAQVIKPLVAIKTKEDVATVKKAAEDLKDAATKRRDVLNGLQTNMTTQLKAAGLSDDMASQVTNLFLERNGIPKQAARSDALAKLADSALGVTDYLEKNAGKWKPGKETGISFTDKKTLEGFQASYQQVQLAIQQVNSAL
jgi:hypothetical protein